MTDQSYPLHWPMGWPRTPMPLRSKFGANTVHQAVQELNKQLRMIKAVEIVISANVTLSSQTPRDKGVCVYFKLRGKPYSLPCDRWDVVSDNLRALAKHIESLRGQERWGVGTVERAFAGYLALGDGKKTWREVFGYRVAEVVKLKELKDLYRVLAFNRHPDRGGSGRHVRIEWRV